MDINEARGDDLALRVNHFFRRLINVSNLCNAVSDNGHVGQERHIAAAIHNQTIFDQQIIHRTSLPLLQTRQEAAAHIQ